VLPDHTHQLCEPAFCCACQASPHTHAAAADPCQWPPGGGSAQAQAQRHTQVRTQVNHGRGGGMQSQHVLLPVCLYPLEWCCCCECCTCTCVAKNMLLIQHPWYTSHLNTHCCPHPILLIQHPGTPHKPTHCFPAGRVLLFLVLHPPCPCMPHVLLTNHAGTPHTACPVAYPLEGCCCSECCVHCQALDPVALGDHGLDVPGG
jgi:hypothetical protein